MEDNTEFQDQQDAEEALSLNELPINSGDMGRDDIRRHRDRRSSSEPTDFFEFFSDVSSEMSHAEDIIFCGKLVPFKEQHIRKTTNTVMPRDEKIKSFFHRRRSESLPEIKATTSQYENNMKSTRFTRNSGSMDYRKLRRNSSMRSEPPPDIHRNCSMRSCSGGGGKVARPRWYILLFGPVKFPPEMDLKNIKSRQVRKSPSSLFPAADGRKNVPVRRRDRRSSWGILRLLSCKDTASVAVTASFGCMPPM